jgi:hypothetical protein
MQKNEDRLDQIEKELTPRQKFFARLEKERCIDSNEVFQRLSNDDWYVDRSSEEPLGALLRHVVDPIEKRDKSSDPQTINNCTREASRYILFLHSLVELIRWEFDSGSDLVKFYHTKLTALVELMPKDSENDDPKATTCCEQLDFLTAPFMKELACFLTMATALRVVVDDLQTRYFEGHSVLRKDQTETLHFYRREAASYVRMLRDASDPKDLQNVLMMILPDIELEPAKSNQCPVDVARSVALYAIDDYESAAAFKKRGLKEIVELKWWFVSRKAARKMSRKMDKSPLP